MNPPPHPLIEPVIPLLPENPDPWAAATWEGAELATLRAAARLSFTEKVAWLEDAHRLHLQFQQARREQGVPTLYPDGHIES
ncbi:MAG TPA: hypothetical protein VH253_14505 [Phycisphaerae bacterium]|nr:hypothetical protein [Phycisphaerae bacterium]